MPSTKLLAKHLTDEAIQQNGKYLVVELTADHVQPNCTPVPAGTRGIIVGRGLVQVNAGQMVFLFPHSVLNEPVKSFTDGDLRVLPPLKEAAVKVLGRIDHR